MKQITIKYDTQYSSWLKQIENGLNRKNILYSKQMSKKICTYLRLSVRGYLFRNGYKPNDTITYRKELVKRLNNDNKYIIIKSNNNLWKVLEYFIDLDKYPNCFDIFIKSEVSNNEKNRSSRGD